MKVFSIDIPLYRSLILENISYTGYFLNSAEVSCTSTARTVGKKSAHASKTTPSGGGNGGTGGSGNGGVMAEAKVVVMVEIQQVVQAVRQEHEVNVVVVTKQHQLHQPNHKHQHLLYLMEVMLHGEL